ncbi:MAG: DUF3236 domain-containing protein [Methanospirillum sp.]|uniref:DUF3236 domain-containing protein n=1 Tax=Methanospirillum sp. TaxID=45200 RepID=UPI00237033D9|nr:DUF3236 domain-containing protein [Methanospirillum sp.]MDD1728266.1 DUF3236 domain-containing protein [Methanospirillum sp.]
MSLEESIKHAYHESVSGERRGDTRDELEEIKSYIRSSNEIRVPNGSGEKLDAINEVLWQFGLTLAKHLPIHTNSCDVTRMPAITKGFMALDVSVCDLVIARGRLGVPGSGSMLVIMDKKGRILSAALSPAHVLHEKSLVEAVRDEMQAALDRIGLVPLFGRRR